VSPGRFSIALHRKWLLVRALHHAERVKHILTHIVVVVFPPKSSATPTELVNNPGRLPTCPNGMVNFSQMWLMGQVERTA
jgi:hypothetical protein